MIVRLFANVRIPIHLVYFLHSLVWRLVCCKWDWLGLVSFVQAYHFDYISVKYKLVPTTSPCDAKHREKATDTAKYQPNEYTDRNDDTENPYHIVALTSKYKFDVVVSENASILLNDA